MYYSINVPILVYKSMLGDGKFWSVRLAVSTIKKIHRHHKGF